MRRHTSQPFVSPFYHQQMTILHTGIEMNTVGAQFFIQETNQFIGFLGRDMPGRMVLQNISFHTYDVTPHGHVPFLKVYSDTSSFQHPTAFVNLGQVISHYRHIGHLTPRMKSVGYGLQHTRTSHACQFVHIRSLCILQQGLSSQRRNSPVGHAVAQYNKMFHDCLF